MDEKPSFRSFLAPTFLLVVGGWGGLALLLNFSLPTLWPRWGFFALIVLAFTGIALPVSFFLNVRLGSNDPGVAVRQAVWVGIYWAILAWLQIAHILSFSVALWLVLGFMAVEYLLQLRGRGSKPKDGAGAE